MESSSNVFSLAEIVGTDDDGLAIAATTQPIPGPYEHLSAFAVFHSANLARQAREESERAKARAWRDFARASGIAALMRNGR